MSIVAASLYRDGKRIGPVSLDQPVRCATDRSEFVWIGLFEPSEAELRQLQENYDLHPLAIEVALLAHQLPKLDIYGDQLFVVARPAHLADGQICYGETSVAASPHDLRRNQSCLGKENFRWSYDFMPLRREGTAATGWQSSRQRRGSDRKPADRSGAR
jgi:Mg2+ and Co2+ transporter CorA